MHCSLPCPRSSRQSVRPDRYRVAQMPPDIPLDAPRECDSHGPQLGSPPAPPAVSASEPSPTDGMKDSSDLPAPLQPCLLSIDSQPQIVLIPRSDLARPQHPAYAFIKAQQHLHIVIDSSSRNERRKLRRDPFAP